ncbi:hypothetical protein [Eubacterium oxidoreducens]|uniref:4-hydroxyphenylacetate decarboxylase small subunit n=1 Tax=Eubacterium oxidoreducens TaxID=1732 RepID=A0A1G6B3E3_EUBOX|nr:hypothetical protein [Eubacterium oxidoreducens]SDB15164.1 hypothetical protein SAMN02910417_01120 [Eubacterium oxidoreducens]
MIAIKDMEMPKSCKECPMSHYVFGDGWEIWCNFTKKNVATPNHNCPLVEIITCEHCKYWHDDGIMTTCDKNIGNGFPQDYFCGDAERKE